MLMQGLEFLFLVYHQWQHHRWWIMHRQTCTLNTHEAAFEEVLVSIKSSHQSTGHYQGQPDKAVLVIGSLMPPFLLEEQGRTQVKTHRVRGIIVTFCCPIFSTSSELKSEYKRVSTNTSLLHKSDYSSKSTTVGSDVTSTLQHRQSFGSMTSSNFGYLTPTSRRRW